MTLAIVIAHGDLTVTDEVEDLVRRADLIVAADGGSLHAVRHGWWPHWLVGDLDSTPPEIQRLLQAHDAAISKHSPRKDETDTELAVRVAVEQGADEIYLLGATGGRLDHTLANILLLGMEAFAPVRLTILAGQQRLTAIRGQGEIHGRPGDLVSLLPIGGDAVRIWTEGLEYPLRGETLRFGIPRGISNVLTAPIATIRLESGILLAVITPAE